MAGAEAAPAKRTTIEPTCGVMLYNFSLFVFGTEKKVFKDGAEVVKMKIKVIRCYLLT